MPMVLNGHAAVSLGSDLALVCGGTSSIAQKTCYSYSASANSWPQTHSLNTPRTQFGMVRWTDGGYWWYHSHTTAYSEYVYAFGGQDNNNNALKSVEYLKPSEDWLPGVPKDANAALCVADYGFTYAPISNE
jgi:hypothetical protein